MWRSIFTLMKNLNNYLSDFANLMPMPTPKRAPLKKVVTPSRPLTARPATSTRIDGVSGWEIAAKIALTLGIFLIPLLVGSWTPDRWEVHKTILLLAVVTIGWFCFFLSQFRRPTVSWRWHPLDWLVLGLGASALVGTATSMSPATSLFGLQGAYAETLPVILSFVSIYFLAARLFRTSAERFIVWAALLGGIGFSLLLQLFQFSDFSLLPAALSSSVLFSTMSNSSLQVAILAAIVGTVGLLLWPNTKERWSKVGLAMIVTIGWLSMLFLSQAVAWAVFAVGMIVVVIGQTGRPAQASMKLVMVAVALAAVGMLSQFLKVSTYTNLPSTAESTLRQSTSAATAFSAVLERPVLGTGPNTWFDAFVFYRPLSYNNDVQWSGRYLRSGAEWSQVLATQGVAGLSLWIGIILIAGWEMWRRMKRGFSFTLLAGMFIVLVVALTMFLTTWSFTLLAVIWVTLGLVRAKLSEGESKELTTKNSIPAVGFALTVILAIVVWYPAARVYGSQMFLQRAQTQIDKQASAATLIKTLGTAVRYDSHNLDAGVLLANAYVLKIQEDLQANNIPAAQKDLTDAQSAARAAVKKNPVNPAAYEAENNILNSLATYLPNPEEQANENFAKLRELEPANPIHDVGYGQTLLVIRARAAANTATPANPDQQAKLLARAMQAFNQALEKKSDYLQARYARADAEMTAEQYRAALDDLEQLTNASPAVSVFWASKGMALAKLDQLDQAKAAYEQSLKLDDQDPNTYLGYSEILNAAKLKDEAKAVLERGVKAIPGNTDLTDAVAKLGT